MSISGPVIGARGLSPVRLHDVVRVGEAGLVGEVIHLSEEIATLQVYEETSGLRAGEPVKNTGAPLRAALGPGLLASVYDGLQRPLIRLAGEIGHFIERGAAAPPLADKKWTFTPAVEKGAEVQPGVIFGTVPEGQLEHRIPVPEGISGTVVEIEQGELHVDETAAVIENSAGERLDLNMIQEWPVRQSRPFREDLSPREPVITGTRVIDMFFPVAKGGSAIIPGGFGTGKTVTQQSISRWSDVDIVVYVGCGERGNEMTEVLEEFPELEDPRSGNPLMERTVLIANTSDMPVAAREASIYTGITIAEYYRDMGYDVLLLADSTSRWGEAQREISGRLEEMPGEEGFPAYLASRLAGFYERAGRVIPLGVENGDRTGSVTIIGAISPPGGDFSEPITQNSMRLAGAFWSLDTGLARKRHFPAIHPSDSYSLYDLGGWYEAQGFDDWDELTRAAMILIGRDEELQEIIQLVGPDALSESEQVVTFTARMLREDFLQQSALHDVDRFSTVEKTRWMLQNILRFYDLARRGLDADLSLADIRNMQVVDELARMKTMDRSETEENIETAFDKMEKELEPS